MPTVLAHVRHGRGSIRPISTAQATFLTSLPQCFNAVELERQISCAIRVLRQ